MTGPRIAAWIAARLAGPGTMATARGTRIRNGTVSESAVRGTSARLGKQPSFTCCLPAGLVELHHPHVRPLREVADRRVDEGEVAVLPDPEDGEGRARLPQQRGVARALGREVLRLAVEAVERGHLHVGEEPVDEEPPEGGRVVGGDADVLVEVERGELRPVDPGLLPQRGQELVLRGSGGEDDGGPAVARQEVADRLGHGARRREAHHGPAREDLDAQATAGEDPRARALRGTPPPELVRGPAEEVRQGHLRVLDLGVPALLPLEGDPAVAARRVQPVEHARGREVAAAGQDRGPRDLPVGRAPLVLEVDVAQEGAERRGAGLGLLAELGEGVGGVPDRAEPLAPRLLQERAGRGGGREVAVRLEPDLDAGAAEAVAQVGRAPRRSSPASRRDRRPAARGRRRRGCRGAPRRAATSAVALRLLDAPCRRAAGSGLWKKERVSTQGTARPASARRASVSRRPEPVSSGRAQSASSPSRKRSSTPS